MSTFRVFSFLKSASAYTSWCFAMETEVYFQKATLYLSDRLASMCASIKVWPRSTIDGESFDYCKQCPVSRWPIPTYSLMLCSVSSRSIGADRSDFRAFSNVSDNRSEGLKSFEIKFG